MKKLFAIGALWSSSFLLANAVSGACCAWDDRDACSNCPQGYISGCRTEGNKCRCSCAENERALFETLGVEAEELHRVEGGTPDHKWVWGGEKWAWRGELPAGQSQVTYVVGHGVGQAVGHPYTDPGRVVITVTAPKEPEDESLMFRQFRPPPE